MKQTSVKKKTYRTLFNVPKQNCMQNLERFRQSSILSKKPSALFPPKPSLNSSQVSPYQQAEVAMT